MATAAHRSTSQLPLRYYVISLLFPLSVILVLRVIPQIDLTVDAPAAHFYIVTALSFVGIILAGLANTLSRVSGRAQALWVSLGMLTMSGLLFNHGLATPNVLLVGPSPGSGWAAKLSLVVGGIFFVLSGLPWSTSLNDLLIKRSREIIAATWLIYAAFFIVVFLFPAQLAQLDQAGPLGLFATLAAAIAVYTAAIILYILKVRAEHRRLDGMILVGLLILATAIFSQNGTVWHLSWWAYHFLMGTAIVIITIELNNEYGYLRSASLLRNYLVFGLTAIALLGLVASEVFFRINRDNLARERQTSAVVIAQHLVLELQSDLPQAGTQAGLQALAADPQIKNVLDDNLRGLNVLRVKIYDSLARIAYSTATFTPGEAQANSALLEALSTGQATSDLEDTSAPEVADEPGLSGQVIETYAPIRDANDQLIGVLEIYQDANDLAAVAIQQRGQFLFSVSILMLLLFGGFAVVVRRADLRLADRAQELAGVQAALAQSERTRADMTNIVVNNLRRPLAALAQSVEQLEQSRPAPEQSGAIARAKMNAQEATNTLYNLLNISQMENGELRIQQSSFPIAELLQLNAQNMADAAREASCDIRVEARFDLPNVWADRDLINQVIANLLSNALKHTRHGSNVLLSADSDHEGHVIVYVHDQGEGISAEDQTRIFEKFARTRRGGSPDGTGLGLAFCKQAIELHSGRIWVESTVGRGSTFAFSLPTLTTVAAI